MVNKIRIIILVLVLTNITACNLFFNKEEAKKKVLSEDPSFQAVLEQKQQVDNRIKQLKKELSDKKNTIDSKIKELRSGFAEEKKKVDLESKTLEIAIDKHRMVIKTEISDLSSRLKTKEKILKNIESAIRVSKSLLSKDSNLSLNDKERYKWKDRASELKLQKEDITKDIKFLRRKMQVEKMKLRLLEH